MTDLQTNEMMRVMTTETPVESVDDFDAPASRGFVRYEVGKLRTEMIAGFAGLQDAMVKGDASLRQELRDSIGVLRDEMVKGDANLRQELGDEIVNGDASLRAEIHRLEVGLRQDMASMHRSLLRWFVATQIATIGVVAALINSLGG